MTDHAATADNIIMRDVVNLSAARGDPVAYAMMRDALRARLIAELKKAADHGRREADQNLLGALLNVRKIISEGALTGFNFAEGDWAERLFASQQATSAAIAKAEGREPQ